MQNKINETRCKKESSRAHSTRINSIKIVFTLKNISNFLCFAAKKEHRHRLSEAAKLATNQTFKPPNLQATHVLGEFMSSSKNNLAAQLPMCTSLVVRRWDDGAEMLIGCSTI